MKKAKATKFVPKQTASRVDFPFLLRTKLPTVEAIDLESYASGMTKRGIRRAIRHAMKADPTKYENLAKFVA